MARGRKTSLTIRLTPAERQTLLAWQRATTSRAGLVRRTRIILLLAEGVTITAIAATVGLRFFVEMTGHYITGKITLLSTHTNAFVLGC